MASQVFMTDWRQLQQSTGSAGSSVRSLGDGKIDPQRSELPKSLQRRTINEFSSIKSSPAWDCKETSPCVCCWWHVRKQSVITNPAMCYKYSSYFLIHWYLLWRTHPPKTTTSTNRKSEVVFFGPSQMLNNKELVWVTGQKTISA